MSKAPVHLLRRLRNDHLDLIAPIGVDCSAVPCKRDGPSPWGMSDTRTYSRKRDSRQCGSKSVLSMPATV